MIQKNVDPQNESKICFYKAWHLVAIVFFLVQRCIKIIDETNQNSNPTKWVGGKRYRQKSVHFKNVQTSFIYPEESCFKGEIVFTGYGRQIIPQTGGFCAINENNFTYPILLFFFIFTL